MDLRKEFEDITGRERPLEPYSISENPEQWAELLDYEEHYSRHLERRYSILRECQFKIEGREIK